MRTLSVSLLLPLLLVLPAPVLPDGAAATHDEVIMPPALSPGGTVALVTPARPQREELITRVKEGLQANGYNVVLAPNLTTQWGYLAGTDEERAEALMEAWRNPDVDAIFSLIGGYGTTRILDKLDYDVIRENPKVFTGLSDITGLHSAIHMKTGLVTFHSPNTSWVLARVEEERPFAVESFWRAIDSTSYPPDAQESPGWTIPMSEPDIPTETIAPGRASGRLIGGNLSLVHALMGTPYEIETEGRILFLEDVNEAPYRVDRMLSTFQMAGKLDGVAGVVLGRFTRADPEDPDRSFTHREVFEHYFAHRDYPVVFNFPVGHVQDNATLPVGALAALDAEAGTLTLLENPVVLPGE